MGLIGSQHGFYVVRMCGLYGADMGLMWFKHGVDVVLTLGYYGVNISPESHLVGLEGRLGLHLC